MDKECQCTNVTFYDTGWQCILCGEKFVRIRDIDVDQAGEQLPVIDPPGYRSVQDQERDWLAPGTRS